MHFSPAALLALLPCAVADFLIITDYPAALATMNAAQAQSYISSLLPALSSEFLGLATDSSYIARATSALPELQRFGATATISLPAAATALDAFEIYTTVPPWYSALPSGVRSLYDDMGKSVEGFLRANAAITAGNATSARVTSTATLSGTTGSVVTPVVTPSAVVSTTSLPEATGKAGRVEVGMGVVVVGVIGAMM